jgi:hypothetical protein
MGDQGRIVTDDAEADGGVRSMIGDLFLLAELGERWPDGFGNYMYLEFERWGGLKFLLYLPRPPAL